MNVPLDSQAQKVLSEIVAHLASTTPGDPRTYLGYKEVHDALGLSQVRTTYGDSLKHQGLEALAIWTRDDDRPAITGLIVDRTSNMPGRGFFNLFGRQEDDFHWWTEQVRLAKHYDWSPYLAAPIPPQAPDAIDLVEPTRREETTTYRIIRDTVMARRIKALHNWECQICGGVMILQDGSRYAEAHHLHPLGRPHDGPDVSENLLCLCPNHHAELDYGVRALQRSALREVAGHSVGEEFLRYHNEIVRGA
jgi:hypothetical protein